MSRLLGLITLSTVLSFFVFSCGKDDEPPIPPQGYIVFDDSDTITFNHLAASSALENSVNTLIVTAGNYPNGDVSQTPSTLVKFSMPTNTKKGFFNDKRCAGCFENPVLEVTNNGEIFNSGTCYIDTNSFNSFSAELFYNQKGNAETITFWGTLCHPTSDTTFTTLRVKGVMQDAPF